MNDRQKKLIASMRENGLDAALITSGVNVRYYTGFTSDECMVLLTEQQCYLLTDFRYTIQAVEQTHGDAEVLERGMQGQYDTVRELLAGHACRVCGFEEDAVTFAQYRKYADMPVEWKPFGGQISIQRLIKTADEVNSLQKAQAIADEAFTKLLNYIRPGVTEAEVAAELQYVSNKLGSERQSFDPIIGSGPNGAMCHAVPGARKLRDGDMVVMDFGCTVDGYGSDMTRTIGIGHVDEECRTIYDIVLDAQKRALDALHGGITGHALDAVARSYIASKGYGENFGHGLGHGFGLQIHEPPRAGKNSEDVLLPGMTITVEPGIYLEGKAGVRIEDCCVVTETGCINLVSSPKELILI